MHVSLTTFCSCPACGHCSICLSDFLQACGKAGQVDQTISLPNEWLFLFVFVLVPVIAERNEIPAAYREQLERFFPVLRLPEFGLGRAADYLQSWCDGSWERQPLLDLSQSSG